MNRGDIAVIDVGKTHTGLVRVDAADPAPLATVRLATPSRRDGPYPHPDTEAIRDWLLDGLAAFVRAASTGLIRPATAWPTSTHWARSCRAPVTWVGGSSNC